MATLSDSASHFTRLFTDAYRYREVLFNMLARDLKVKYKRTFFGYFWSVLNPILQLSIMAAVFSHLVRQEMKNYLLYLFSGFLAWSFFQTSVLMSGLVFLENENFIKKVYLPKLIFPLSKLCFRMIDFLVSLAVLSLLGVLLGFSMPASFAAVPAAIILFFFFTLGASILVGVGTVYFRDLQYLTSVGLQLLYFATPILYPLSAMPPKYQVWLKLNPLYSQIQLFHTLIYEGRFPIASEWLAASLAAGGLFGVGMAVLFLLEEDLVFRM
ncbi:ABC transporter permease [bacterium]|nr:ABC transporter permease [bacterium]